MFSSVSFSCNLIVFLVVVFEITINILVIIILIHIVNFTNIEKHCSYFIALFSIVLTLELLHSVVFLGKSISGEKNRYAVFYLT